MATDRKDIRLEYYDREGYEILEEAPRYTAISYPFEQSYYGGGAVGPGLLIYFFNEYGTMTGSVDIFNWIPEIDVMSNLLLFAGLKEAPSHFLN